MVHGTVFHCHLTVGNLLKVAVTTHDYFFPPVKTTDHVGAIHDFIAFPYVLL